MFVCYMNTNIYLPENKEEGIWGLILILGVQLSDGNRIHGDWIKCGLCFMKTPQKNMPHIDLRSWFIGPLVLYHNWKWARSWEELFFSCLIFWGLSVRLWLRDGVWWLSCISAIVFALFFQFAGWNVICNSCIYQRHE